MKNLKSLLFSVLFLFVLGSVSASNSPDLTSTRMQIRDMIVKSKISSFIKVETTVHVTFLVNQKNEIIVLSTDSDVLDKNLKSVLNYKKLTTSDFKVNETYTLPIVLKL